MGDMMAVGVVIFWGVDKSGAWNEFGTMEGLEVRSESES